MALVTISPAARSRSTSAHGKKLAANLRRSLLKHHQQEPQMRSIILWLGGVPISTIIRLWLL